MKARLTRTLEFIKSLDQAVIGAAADKDITFPAGGGTQRTLKGTDCLVLSGPNFYFHVTTAYNILRHCGVSFCNRERRDLSAASRQNGGRYQRDTGPVLPRAGGRLLPLRELQRAHRPHNALGTAARYGRRSCHVSARQRRRPYGLSPFFRLSIATSIETLTKAQLGSAVRSPTLPDRSPKPWPPSRETHLPRKPIPM